MKSGGKGKHAFGDAEWWGKELFGIDNALVGLWPVVVIEKGKAVIKEYKSILTGGTPTASSWSSTSTRSARCTTSAARSTSNRRRIAGVGVPPLRLAGSRETTEARFDQPATRMFELILQTCLNAVYAASFMALVAVGLVLIFGVMGIINFAHGELYMLARMRSSRSTPMPSFRSISRSPSD